MGKHGRSRGTSWTIFVRSSIGWTIVGKRFRRSFIITRMGENVPNWECMFVHRKQRVILVEYMWMTIKMAGKEADYDTHAKNRWWNIVDIDEPTSFLDHVYLGCTQRECKPNETIIEQYKKMFESRISARSNTKIARMVKKKKTSRANRSVVLRHGRTCSKLRWAILWTGKRESGATVPSFKSFLGWSSI